MVLTRGRLWGGGAALLGVLAAVLVIRTVMLRPPSIEGAGPRLPPAPSATDAAAAVAVAARHLGEAIRFPTVSHENPDEDDRGAWDAQRAWLAATYPALHAAAVRELLDGGALLYTWTGSEPGLPPVIFMAHQDVVPVAAESANQWRAPPFGGEIKEGAVWGRGAIDDKGSLVSLMEAAEALARRGFRPRRTIYLVSGQDEEVGGTGARAAAALLERRGVHAAFALDEGMAVIEDYPGTGQPVAVIGVAEKGIANLKVTARAAGGHSSAPPKDTAVVSVARAVVAINDHGFPLRYGGLARDSMRGIAPQMPFLARLVVANDWLFAPLLVRAIAATPAGAAVLHTTTAPTMLAGSPKSNVLPTAASAIINYRIAPGDTPDDVLARARGAVATLPVSVEFDGTAQAPSPVASTAAPGFQAIAALAADIAHAPVVPGLVTGATDSRSFAAVAQNVYRFQPIRLHLKDIEMVHGVNEHLTLENLGAMLQFYQRLMVLFAG